MNTEIALQMLLQALHPAVSVVVSLFTAMSLLSLCVVLVVRAFQFRSF